MDTPAKYVGENLQISRIFSYPACYSDKSKRLIVEYFDAAADFKRHAFKEGSRNVCLGVRGCESVQHAIQLGIP